MYILRNLLYLVLGRFLTLVWSLFSMFLVMFYSCNLLAALTSVQREPRVHSNEDVLLQERGAYLPALMPRLRWRFNLKRS